MGTISNLFNSVKAKKDWKENWKDDAKQDWIVDWDPASGDAMPAPVNTAAPSIAGTAKNGQTLTGSVGTWTGTGITYSYQWRRGASNIAGATGLTYVVQAADIGATLTFRVTAVNLGSPAGVVATSAATATVIA